LYKCIRQLQMDGANKYTVVKRYRFMFLRGKKTTEPKLKLKQ